MILTVDIGNTQIKWAVFASGKFSLFGRCPLSSVKKLPLYWKDLPNPEKIVVSNVAGEVAAEAIVAAITNWDINPYWVESQPLQCGVTNSYDEPRQLGSDRWAMLIGSHSLGMGNVVVVCAGTATTIHGLTADGKFLGGLIIPGYELMHQSLGKNADLLQSDEGAVTVLPRSTQAAITSGIVKATCTTIDSFCDDMARSGHEPDKIILSGGAAEKFSKSLSLPVIVEDHLVMKGLLEISRDITG